MTQEIEIRLEGLNCRRGKLEVLRGVTLSVFAGQIALIVGQNGSGKSTLLRVLAGLERPTSGTGSVAGHDLARRPVEVRKATGYVPELPAFEEEFSVQEQLAFHARLAGLAPSEANSTVASMLELLELTELRSRFPDTLSRGQLQRLAIGRALVHDPTILLLDEPLLALDEVGGAELAEVLDELRALGKTIVLASRLPGILLSLADATYSLVGGELTTPENPSGDAGVRLRLAVIGDGERLRALLAERDDVGDVRFEEPVAEGDPLRLSVALRVGDQVQIAQIVRSIVEGGESVVEVFAEPAEVAAT